MLTWNRSLLPMPLASVESMTSVTQDSKARDSSRASPADTLLRMSKPTWLMLPQ